MSEPITVATVGAPAAKVVIDPPPKVDAPAIADAAKPGEPTAAKPDGEVPAGQDAKDPNLGRAFAALARKDQSLRNREDQVKREAEQIKAIRDVHEAARSKKPEAVAALLESLSIAPGELTDLLLALSKEPSEADRIAAVEKKLAEDKEEREKAAITAEAAELEKAKANFKVTLASTAKAAGDKFELTLAHGDEGIDLAFECVDAHYEKTGKVLPIEEALALAESHYDAQAKKVLGTKKYGQSRPATSSESSAARADNAADTLTNHHVSGGPPAQPRKNLTREESLAEAARLMESRGWGKR